VDAGPSGGGTGGGSGGTSGGGSAGNGPGSAGATGSSSVSVGVGGAGPGGSLAGGRAADATRPPRPSKGDAVARSGVVRSRSTPRGLCSLSSLASSHIAVGAQSELLRARR
jgi:hypothetical protein